MIDAQHLPVVRECELPLGSGHLYIGGLGVRSLLVCCVPALRGATYAVVT